MNISIKRNDIQLKIWPYFFIILPTYPPNFSSFEVSLAEIEFWHGW